MSRKKCKIFGIYFQESSKKENFDRLNFGELGSLSKFVMSQMFIDSSITLANLVNKVHIESPCLIEGIQPKI